MVRQSKKTNVALGVVVALFIVTIIILCLLPEEKSHKTQHGQHSHQKQVRYIN